MGTPHRQAGHSVAFDLEASTVDGASPSEPSPAAAIPSDGTYAPPSRDASDQSSPSDGPTPRFDKDLAHKDFGKKDTPDHLADDEKHADKHASPTPGEDSNPPSRASRWRNHWIGKLLIEHTAWILPNLSWSKLIPVFRSAISAWICMVIMMINPAHRAMGHAAFLVLISSALQPADAPIASIIERELALLFLCTTAWGWSCLAIAIAHAVRKNKLSPLDITDPSSIYRGDYIEAGPAIVCSAFQAFGAAMFLWIKASFGPGPLLFGSVLGCITLNITLTMASMTPYPQYISGQSVLIPLAVKAAVTIIIGILFFPKSNNSLFCERVITVLKPIKEALSVQLDILQQDPLRPNFPFDAVQACIAKAETGMPLLQMSSRLLKREVTVGHASGQDLKDIEILVRKMLPTLDAMNQYFAGVKADVLHAYVTHHPPLIPSQPRTPAPSRLQTPATSLPATPDHSPPGTPFPEPSLAEPSSAFHSTFEQPQDDLNGQPASPPGALKKESSRDEREGRTSHHSHKHDLLSHVLQLNLHPTHSTASSRHPSQDHRRSRSLSRFRLDRHHHASPAPSPRQKFEELHPVGTWESLRYSAVDAYLHPASSNVYTKTIMRKLGESTQELLQANADALDAVINFFGRLNEERVRDFLERVLSPRKPLERLKQREAEFGQLIERFDTTLKNFSNEKRLIVLDPLINAKGKFDPSLPYRYIYQAFMHQAALMDLSKQMLRVLKKAHETCANRKVAKIWLPDLAYWRRFEAWIEVGSANDEEEFELNAQYEQDWLVQQFQYFYKSSPRSPDALEPETMFERLGQQLFLLSRWLFTSTRLFVWKAGLATALASLPQYMHSSAEFCYKNKATWSIFMMQLCLSPHRGDSIFAVWVRIMATAIGACAGGSIWYIASGNSTGNVFGMGATTAVAFPLIYFFRTYCPASPPYKIVLTVTCFLCLGYSWTNTHFPPPDTHLTYGVDIMWRRMVNTFIGLGAAFVVSLLPPSQTLRAYQRRGHARCIADLTLLTSNVLTFGQIHPDPSAVPDTPTSDRALLTKSLISLRSRIRRLKLISANTRYEVSLRGKWPQKRYQELNTALQDAVKTLTCAFNVLKAQPGPWARALLKRLRLSDPRFIGDLFAVMHMAHAALAAGAPLPQITPAPLFDRLFFLKNDFDIVSAEDMDDTDEEEFFAALNLPRHLDRATLENINYFRYAAGATAWAGFILRLDRLALAVKELCGEDYNVPTNYRTFESAFEKLEQIRQLQAQLDADDKDITAKKNQ